MRILFWIITGIALLVSGNATYEVLTSTVGIQTYIALAAAVVIDAAAIWLGHHTTVLARLGDNTRNAQLATWVVILISFAVNFFHGYTAGGYAGGFVGIIFPFLAAILYDFYIRHTIREELRLRGRILPETPVVLKSRKYGDKARHTALQRDYVSLTYEIAETKMGQLRDSLRQPRDNETEQRDSRDTEIDFSLTDETAETTAGLATQVDQVFAAQMLRDINETMTIKQIIETLVGQGIKDYDQLETAVNEVRDKPVSRETIRKTASRVIRDTGKEAA